MADEAEARLAGVRARLETITWPEAAFIDFPPFDEGRPCIAGTSFLVRNMQIYDGYKLSRPDLVLRIKDDWALLTKPGINAALDYWQAHRELFERDQWQRLAPREELIADLRAVLQALDDRDRALAALRGALGALVAHESAAWEQDWKLAPWCCIWCEAQGARWDHEPRHEDHNPDCPWVAAKAALAASGGGA